MCGCRCVLACSPPWGTLPAIWQEISPNHISRFLFSPPLAAGVNAGTELGASFAPQFIHCQQINPHRKDAVESGNDGDDLDPIHLVDRHCGDSTDQVSRAGDPPFPWISSDPENVWNIFHMCTRQTQGTACCCLTAKTSPSPRGLGPHRRPTRTRVTFYMRWRVPLYLFFPPLRWWPCSAASAVNQASRRRATCSTNLMSFVLTLWDRRLQPPRGPAPEKSSDYGAEQGGKTTWVQVLGCKIKRDLWLGCVVLIWGVRWNAVVLLVHLGKLEEVWKEEANKQVKKLSHRSVEHDFAKFNFCQSGEKWIAYSVKKKKILQILIGNCYSSNIDTNIVLKVSNYCYLCTDWLHNLPIFSDQTITRWTSALKT